MPLSLKDKERRRAEELYNYGYITKQDYRLILDAIANENTKIKFIRTESEKGFVFTWEIELKIEN